MECAAWARGKSQAADSIRRRCRFVFSQQRVFQRAVLLLVGEVLTPARHTVTQVLMTLGRVDRDWAAWYRLFRKARFPYPALARKLLEEVLQHVEDGWLVIAGGATSTRRSRRKMEGVGWQPAFLVNAQRGAEGGWVLPMAVEKLLFWAWQRWEIEVTHRELKSTLGLGEKQCRHPEAAVRSVQWSAWVYA